MFPFSFISSISPNPFTTAGPSPPDLTELEQSMPGGFSVIVNANPRKRARGGGWALSSEAAATTAVTQTSSGPAWIDTPSKYKPKCTSVFDQPRSALRAVLTLLSRLFSSSCRWSCRRAPAMPDGDDDDLDLDLVNEHDSSDDEEQQPPTKKRRTIADSVISTALSAALIGAAVGIAAYRVWRDRGKSGPAIDAPPPPAAAEKRPPPPPYHPGDWGVLPETSSHPHHATNTLPHNGQRRIARKPARLAHTVGHGAGRRKAMHLSTAPPRAHTPPPPSLRSPTSSRLLNSPGAPSSDAGSEQTEFDEHADWMGSQLSRLIAEGKRALGQDIVLPSNPDEPDADGPQGETEEWVDEQQERGRQHAHASSLSNSHFGRSFSHARTPPRSPMVSGSFSSSSLRTPVSMAFARDTTEDPGMSPELREVMAKARAARGH